jgi:hypothetical protein
MRATMEEFLTLATQDKRVRFAEITSHHVEVPGGGKLNKKSRVSLEKTPYDSIKHVLRRTVLLGVNYQDMVNVQRGKEADAALLEMLEGLPSFVTVGEVSVEPFIAGPLWGGKGKRDEVFPNFVARHVDTREGYLIFWPKCDKEGNIINHENKYFDQDGRELNFKTEVEEYWEKKSDKPVKVQETKRPIRWTTLKFSNVVQIKANKLTWDIETPVVRALA